MSSALRVTVYTDGASRHNPGPAGAGAFLLDEDGEYLDEAYLYLGETTNNVAEYRAVILGLERAAELGAREVVVRADSELVVRQLLGEYRIRNEALRALAVRVRALERAFSAVAYVHVRREQNRDADRLANLAIDEAKSI